MKLTATIVVSFQAQTLAEAGAKLDDVLAPVRTHGHIEIRSVDIQTPTAGPPITLPPAPQPRISAPIGPHPLPGSG